MAKKQGTSYSPNTALIQGAGVAYKNYDNVPGMYAGLDKGIKAGMGMVDEAVKGYEAEQEKIKKEEEEAKTKKAQQDKDWYAISEDVYANAGSFMKDVEYKNTSAAITDLKKEWIAAQKSGNPDEVAAVQIKFNNIKGEVDDHKTFRETITDPKYGLSAAMDASGVREGSNGEDKAFMTGLIAEDYTISTEGGEKYYNVGGVKKTMKQIKDMAILKDNIPFAAYQEAREKHANKKKWDRESVEYDVRNNIIPKDVNKLRAFLADDGFGNGKNFAALLNDSKNKASIMDQIDMTLFNTNDTGASKGKIDDAEYAEFVLAVTDPKHKTWDKGDGTFDEAAWQTHASEIATEQLVNGIKNKQALDNPEDPIWKQKGYANEGAYRKANLELTTPTKTPFSADSSYGPKGSTVKGRQINNYWNMLDSGKMTLGDPGVEYNRNTETGAWINSQDQTEISGSKILEIIQKGLNKDAGGKQTYNILNDQNFKQFSGATTSGTYTMPQGQESTVAKLWNNAASGASGSSEKFAVSTLNTTFGGGFTQEDAGNKWMVGYNGMTFNLKTPGDKDKLLAEIKKQKLIDQKLGE